MAKLLARELSGDLYARLSGAALDSLEDKAVVLVTVDADGWPHPAMLSYFEIAAPDRANVRLAIHAGSRTTANLRDRRKATLILIDRRLVCYIKGDAEQLAPAMRTAAHNAKVNVRIEQVLTDAPDPRLEPGAYVSDGVRYVSGRTAEALQQARAVVSELLE